MLLAISFAFIMNPGRNGHTDVIVLETIPRPPAPEANIVTEEPLNNEDVNGDTPHSIAPSEPDVIKSDGDLLFSEPLPCKRCQKMVNNFQTDGPVYLCYYCTELNLCEECYQHKLAVERGDEDAKPDWRVTCAKGHQYVKAPVDGWGGLSSGVMTINGEKIAFNDWLTELKTKRWKEAWEQYWL